MVKTATDIQITGVFDTKRFYETLALIVSNRENMLITVKVSQELKRGGEPYRAEVAQRQL